MTSSRRAGSSPAFQNACGTPRGLKTRSPGPASSTSSPSWTPIRPSRTYEYSSSFACVHRRAERARRERVLDEAERASRRLPVDHEADTEREQVDALALLRAEHMPDGG